MKIRKAVIPAAGLGTRHFPASHAVKKELFPVVGPDGIARALVHYHLLDLFAAGIEEVCLIVQPGDEAVFQAYLAGPPPEYLGRLEKYPSLREEARQMTTMSARVRYVVQSTQDGYGHAVFQSREFADGEPVLLCLGDHLFRGATVSCAEQMIVAFQSDGSRSLSAVNRIGPDDLKGYGTIAGVRRQDKPDLIDVTRIIEKPALSVARAQLRVDGLGPDEFLGWFGMHILRPSIYEILAAMIRNEVRDNGEFQLTRAQEIQREQEGYNALEMRNARRYDFGVPLDFVRSLVEFAQPGVG